MGKKDNEDENSRTQMIGSRRPGKEKKEKSPVRSRSDKIGI